MKTLIFFALSFVAISATAQSSAERYTTLCADCHTADPNTFFRHSTLVNQSTEAEIGAVIRSGRPERGMPAFATLTDEDARALGAWIKNAVTSSKTALTGTMIGRRIEAEDLRADRSAGYGVAEEGDTRYLQWIDRGSHLCYEDIDLTGVRSIEYRFAKGEGEPPRRFALVAFTGEFASGKRIPLGEKVTPLTGGWTAFRTERLGLERQLEGRYRLCIIGMGGGGVFNLDHFTLSDVPGAHDGIMQTFEAPATILTAGGHTFRMEKVGDIDGEFWSLDILDPNTVIATQKSGAVWLFRRGQRIGPIAGTPAVHFAGQGGMLHVRAHPDYQRNGWIYLTFAEPSGEDNMLTIVRGRIRNERWIDQQTIYRASPKFFSTSEAHYGARIAFDREYLFFGIGDRATQNFAQDLGNPFGKIHRIFIDGGVPPDNPFVDRADAVPTIWSYGHRNPQGVTVDPRTRAVWATEHGPKGGDELNLIMRGQNYGWPVVTFGINYDGTIVSNATHREGIEPPRKHWSPSPGLSNLVMYDGRAFPRWRNHLIVASLAHQQLKLIALENDVVVDEEVLIEGMGRIRDVIVGSDGSPYVALNQPNGQIYRLVPTPDD